MTTYTVVAYRPDGVDTCRGCVMDRSSSDFELRCFQDLTEAARWQADKLMDSPSGREYCSWEFTLLVDGMDDNGWWEVYGDSDREEPPFDQYRRLVDEAWAARKKAKEEQARLAQEAAEREAALKRERDAQAKEARERAELARLQARYGATPSNPA